MAAGFTQEELAFKAGVSREYINYLEREKRMPTVRAFVRVCRAMGVSAGELLLRIEKRL